MSEDKTGGPAFPAEEMNGYHGLIKTKGMTLRDYFAGQALAGLLASRAEPVTKPVLQFRAVEAYQFADAMLEARKK